MKAKLDVLTAELADAIAACDASPLLPLCFDEFMAGGKARDLPVEVRSIKRYLSRTLVEKFGSRAFRADGKAQEMRGICKKSR